MSQAVEKVDELHSDGLGCGIDTASLTAEERRRKSLQAAITGLLMNVLLAAAKLVVGVISGSIAILADGWNNLTDSFSSVVSIASLWLAGKPADRKHPFGYARFEYIASSVIALGMLTVAVQIGYRSLQRILHPEVLETGLLTLAVLLGSLLVKLIQYVYYRIKGRQLVSTVFIAASRDSLADVFATGGVLIATLLYTIYGINVDGPAGLIVSLLIAWSAIDIMKKTATLLIGGKPSSELTELISGKILESDDRIFGVHDLIVHDYGPGSIFATAHVELDSRESFLEAHLIVDCVERKLLREYDIHLLLHADPHYQGDAEHNFLHSRIESIAQEIVPGATVHSLHLFLSDKGVRVASFDVSVPDKPPVKETDFFASFREKMAQYDKELVLWITLDQEYLSVVSDDQPNLQVTADRD